MHRVRLCCPEMEFLKVAFFVGFLGINLSLLRLDWYGISTLVFPSCKMLLMIDAFLVQLIISLDFKKPEYSVFCRGFLRRKQQARAFVKLMSKNSISEKKYTSVHRTGLCTVSELFSTACTRSSRTSYRYWIVPRSAYCSSDRRIFSISYIYRRQPQGRKARELALIGVSLACRAEGQSAHVLFVRTVTEA